MHTAPILDPFRPAPPPPPRRSSLSVVLGLLAGLVVGGAVAGTYVATTRIPEVLAPTVTTTEVTPTPDVVKAIQSLSKLETVTFHMEKVVDLAERQKKVYGLVEVKDAILLVAVGEVVAGCDLASIGDDDVESDFANKKVRVRLPAPKVLHTTLDEQKTHVFSRTTDVLAVRHDDLEARARREAVGTMSKAALEAGILDKARTNAAGAVRSLLEASGFTDVEVVFGDPA